MRERRLREAAENIQRKSASAPHESENSQKEPSLQRISRQISAYSSRPSSQYGDAESPPEWYQHEEGNHTHLPFFTRLSYILFGTRIPRLEERTVIDRNDIDPGKLSPLSQLTCPSRKTRRLA